MTTLAMILIFAFLAFLFVAGIIGACVFTVLLIITLVKRKKKRAG